MVTATESETRIRDVTRAARFRSNRPAVVSIEKGRLVPGTNGTAVVTVDWQGHQHTVPVSVTGQDRPDPVSFRYETLAALTKQGCNAGSCHGSPQGKGGFSLSLFAFDSRHDEESLVRGGFNRRTNVQAPLESLMLKKPLLRVPHVGGKRLRPTDAAFPVLKNWIAEGARADVRDAPDCLRIKLFPGPVRILSFPHAKQQLSVLAYFDDGSTRDVTALATYDTSHHDVASVSASGLVTGARRGQSAVTVRFLEHLESAYFTFVDRVEGFQWPDPPEHNLVDRLVNARLKLLQVAPAETCRDEVFLRRVFLDLTGLLPSVERCREFLADRRPDRRQRLIERLLGSREFARFQALRLADLLRVNPQVLTDGRARLFADWIARAVEKNLPFDELARRVLTASGDTRHVAPANYFAAIPMTEDVAEATAQVFMGSRIQCAKCHNHPFESWTQDDYYSIGAVFHRVKRNGQMVSIAASGEMTNPLSGRVMQPWGSRQVQARLNTGGDRREMFARWLTARGNPFFARVAVNRIWAHLLGRGIVDPIDDFRSSNPPSNVELLDALATVFEKSGFDRRQVFRLVCNSQTYQRSTAANRFNQDDEELFSRGRVRLLTAEQLQDAVGYVTGTLRSAEKTAELVADLEKELQQVRKELSEKRGEWESSLLSRLNAATWWEGGWWSVGPFQGGNHKKVHGTGFSPEADRTVRLDQTFENGKLSWQSQLGWRREQKIDLGKGGAAAIYVYHTVFVKRSSRGKLHLSADDGMKVWHDGKLVFDQLQITDNEETQFAEVDLRQGLNRFLVKVVNGGGAFHFTWRLLPLEPGYQPAPAVRELPGYIAEMLAKPGEKQDPGRRAQVDAFYTSRDGRVADLTRRIDMGGRFDYATQRPFPERTDFLKAFGQPERRTPCACERSGEPTLDQALQLLNGKKVHDQVGQSLKRYQKLANQPLVEELYLSALSRLPTARERQATGRYLEASGDDRSAAIRDLVWAVLNTQEFMFQH